MSILKTPQSRAASRHPVQPVEAVDESGIPGEGQEALSQRIKRHAKTFLSTSALLALGDQAVVSGGNFFTTVILGRCSSDADLGIYRLGMSLVAMLVSVPMALIWTPYNVYSSEMSARREASYRSSARTHLFLLAGPMVLGLLIVGLFATPPRSGLFFTLSAVLLMLLSREHLRRMCFARMSMRDALCLDVGVVSLQFIGLAGLAYMGWLTGSRALLVIGVAAAIALLVVPGLPKTHHQRRRSRLLADFRKNWKMSKFVFAGTLLFAFSNGAYPWLLEYFWGAQAVSRLAASEGAIFLANPLLLAAANFFGPSMAHHYRRSGLDALCGIVIWSTLGIVAVMLLFCTAMFFWGGWFVESVFGRNYGGLSNVVVSLALSQIVTAALIPLRAGLLALDQGHLLIKGGFLRLVCLATIGVAAVRAWGPMGVGVGMLCGDLSALLLKAGYLGQLVRERRRKSLQG